MNNNTIRNSYNLNLDWKFILGEEPDAWQKGFDDSTWRTVNIPHDWSIEQPFDINHSSGTGYLPGGTGYYRKKFFLPRESQGKRVYITFDGVYNNSMVWCNSYYLGKRPYGYTTFTYDITDFTCVGDIPNVLTVKVDHKNVADSRWYTGSGIYRKVTVTVKDRICIDNYGVFVSVKNVNEKKAELDVQTTVMNTTDEDADISVKNSIYDAENNLVSFIEGKLALGQNECVTENQNIVILKPRIWSTDSPYLYTCVTEIKKDDMIIDCETTTTGIRTFKFDADKGFFLNGKNMKIKGVCIHYDAGCLGVAVRKKVWERRLEILKDMGCNAIRMSHNPHMPELYDLCDAMGFLVIDEAFDEWEGVKNKWVKGHNVYPPAHYGYYEDFPHWHEADLAAMVLRDRNHPSVILWSIGNEVDYPNDPYGHPAFKIVSGNNDADKPAAERIYDPNRPNAERLVSIAKKLYAIIKKHDETRPVTAALALPELSNMTGLAGCLDVVGYNYMEHLYEEDHKKYPDRIILGSENVKDLDQWLTVKNNDYISGQFLWTGIDFLGETRVWPCHGSEAGLLDIAGFEKPGYYFRKSLWTDKPMVRLFTTCEVIDKEKSFYNNDLRPVWDYPIGQIVQVICFTNCTRTELFLNGRSLGIKSLKDNKHCYLAWEVPYEKGELKAVSTDEKGLAHEYSLKTTGAPVGIRLYCIDKEIASDGMDMTHVILEVVDSCGNNVHQAHDLIHVTVEGAGVLLGLENGNLEDTMPYRLPYRRAYNGKLLIYVASNAKKGVIKVKAKANGLVGGETTVVCK